MLSGPSDITLTVFLSEAGVLHPLFSTNGYMNSTWIEDRVNYNSSSLHKVTYLEFYITFSLFHFLVYFVLEFILKL